MNTLFNIHSGLRWLIVLVGIVAIVWLAVRWMQRKPYDRTNSILMMAFMRLLEIQMLLGLIYLIWNGIDADYWPRQRFEHLVVMTVAVGIAHLPERWESAPDVIRYRNNLLVLVSTLVIIFVGVILLIGGMDRWEFDVF